jgi:hypothetical protein
MFATMQFNRREFAVAAALVLGWACMPLGIFFLFPEYAGNTGAVMLVGGVVAAGATVALVFRHARRLAKETDRRLGALGFEVAVVTREPKAAAWFPAEHRHRSPKIDGFAVAGNDQTREVYRRDRDGVRVTLFGYSYPNGGGQRRAGFAVARFESDAWNWPAFNAAMASGGSQGFGVEGWVRLKFPEDPGFSGEYWLQAPEAAQVHALFSPAVRRLLLANPQFRFSAEGPVLTVYCPHLRLVPGEAEQLLEQAGRLVTKFTALASGRD